MVDTGSNKLASGNLVIAELSEGLSSRPDGLNPHLSVSEKATEKLKMGLQNY